MSRFALKQFVLALGFACSAHAQVPEIYAAYAASTPAFKTNWADGYADRRGFRGNFAKTQSISVQLAKLAYKGDTAERRDALWKLGFVAIKDITRPYSNGPIASDANALVVQDLLARVVTVVVRGSKDADDKWADLTWLPTLDPGSPTLHKGFYDYARALENDVAEALAPFCPSTSRRRLWMTGHSLGGVAASILAHRFNNIRGCKLSGVATFGSPRAGLETTWQATYGGANEDLYYRTQRWVNNNDPVYCTPPGGKWKHVGMEHVIGLYGAITANRSTYGSVCDGGADVWLSWVKAAFTEPSIYAGTALAGAFEEWNRGLINLIFQCSPGLGWDDLWSLGGCSLTDLSGRLRNLWNVSPEEFLTQGIRLGFSFQHKSKSYVDGLAGVNFDDSSSDPWYPIVLE